MVEDFVFFVNFDANSSVIRKYIVVVSVLAFNDEISFTLVTESSRLTERVVSRRAADNMTLRVRSVLCEYPSLGAIEVDLGLSSITVGLRRVRIVTLE